jgi:hypothetical protein
MASPASEPMRRLLPVFLMISTRKSPGREGEGIDNNITVNAIEY